MRIIDWSSDVCSSDLGAGADAADRLEVAAQLAGVGAALESADSHAAALGRAKRLEQLVADEFQVHAVAGIAHLDDRAVPLAAQADDAVAVPAVGLDGILQQVPEDRVDAPGVGPPLEGGEGV